MKRMTLKYSLGLATVFVAVAASAVPAQAANTFSCRASAARVTALGLTLEPFVANRPDSPCASGMASLVAPTTIGPVSAAVINAKTVSNPGGSPGASADVQVTGARVGLPGVPVITANVLHTTATASCTNGVPTFSDSSVVAGVKVGSLAINVPGGNAIVTVPIPLVGTLYINERVATATRVTRRALHLKALLGTDVVVAESTANAEGNPCTTAPPQPECSDGVDNADTEDSLADAADGGCHTDGNPNNPSSYDPNDPSEQNAQCSDGVDNADPEDSTADAADVGCHTDGDPGNPATYNPGDNDETNTPGNCADGKDNDGHGDVDEADPQCHRDGDPKNPDSYIPDTTES
jgi:hypothetical protein